MSRENIITTVVAVLVVLGGAYYGIFVMKKPAAPVVATVPSVATVNGVAVLKSDYDTQLATAVASYKAQGVDVTDPTKLSQIEAQVLDGLVNSEVLLQAANQLGVKPAQTDIDSQYQSLITQAGGQEKFQTQLAAAALTDAKLKENIAKQLTIRAYILQKVDMASATSTTAEIKQYYDTNLKSQKGVPPLKDISDKIAQQIVSNKQQELLNALITSLKAQAKINISTSTASSTAK